ncbi:MAG: GNAT family N-acetyltransferase [Haloarculaceae archaeon]
MEFEILGWPGEEVTLDLDHDRFAYAGKFVMSRTGKAVVRDGGTLVGALAFDADRTDESVCRLRYVTIRADRRGEGTGSELLAFVRSSVVADGAYEAVRIAVNNPYAYDAAYRAGFGYTGEETGLAELVLAWPRPESAVNTSSGSSGTGDGSLGSRVPSEVPGGCRLPGRSGAVRGALAFGHRAGVRRGGGGPRTAGARGGTPRLIRL